MDVAFLCSKRTTTEKYSCILDANPKSGEYFVGSFFVLSSMLPSLVSRTCTTPGKQNICFCILVKKWCHVSISSCHLHLNLLLGIVAFRLDSYIGTPVRIYPPRRPRSYGPPQTSACPREKNQHLMPLTPDLCIRHQKHVCVAVQWHMLMHPA